jgi:Protein of unknown function (DUF1688)
MLLDDSDAAAIAYLRSPIAIRDRCQQLFDLASQDRLQYFRLDLSQLDAVADYVLQVTREAYLDLSVPFHSRWRHFEVGETLRLQHLQAKLAALSAVERAYTQVDLAIVSVLLDAGAGPDWRYVEPGSGEVFQRSEGLAVASFHLFCQGLFSSDRDAPWQVDAIALQNLDIATLAAGLQVSASNPLVGLDGRAQLLQQLGHTLTRYPQWFAPKSKGSGHFRPGHLVNPLLESAPDGNLPANAVLQAVLAGLGDIWAGRLSLGGINLGDVWVHSALAGDRSDVPFAQTLVPFHKLSQWLTYSLLEPLQELGLTITGLDALTGLPEYRNGGLCLDLGLLQLKDPSWVAIAHVPSSELIVEWRALTVILLDQIATTLRHRLDLAPAALPLVKVLQGGTWTAGRKIAAQLRPGGPPPLQITSDGTVF